MNIINNLIHGNSFNIIKEIPENSIDTIFIDPPYNIANKKKLTKIRGKIINTIEAWNSEFKDNYSESVYLKMNKKLSKEFYRILKEGGNFLTFYDYQKPYLLFPFYIYFNFKNVIFMYKEDPLPHFRKTNYRNCFETCAWFVKGDKPNTFHFKSQSKMRNFFSGSNSVKKTKHPTEKFEWMIKPLLFRHTKEKELVADFFMGSGTIPVLSKKYNRSYLGIELSEKWFKIAKERIENIKQIDLKKIKSMF